MHSKKGFFKHQKYINSKHENQKKPGWKFKKQKFKSKMQYLYLKKNVL